MDVELPAQLAAEADQLRHGHGGIVAGLVQPALDVGESTVRGSAGAQLPDGVEKTGQTVPLVGRGIRSVEVAALAGLVGPVARLQLADLAERDALQSLGQDRLGRRHVACNTARGGGGE